MAMDINNLFEGNYFTRPAIFTREVDVSSRMLSGVYTVVGVSGFIPTVTTIADNNGVGVSGVVGGWGGSVINGSGRLMINNYDQIPSAKLYGPPGIKVAEPEAKCPGCFFGSDEVNAHQPDCKWHDKFKPREDPLQALL
jgi:hypothetical protein